ncbi:MAG: tRNA (N6-isopentenyl adenosine(37)-C2)-methylthiotransferase MiaB, partial [Candidatus Poribacteria bacterium]|nr:tRNA (N6-isopentenyl adenosine(37)-C2)-methylthiotransferase MiaB [Candidatus Poribacteria bacterium]
MRDLNLVTLPTHVDDPLNGTVRPFRDRKVHIENYGCQMNVADSEIIRAVLTDAGYEFTPTLRDADVILMNTCAIRENAEDRVFKRLRELAALKRANQALQIGVCGCMAQRLGETIVKRAPHVDLVMGPDAYRDIARALEPHHAPYLGLELDKSEDYADILPVREDGIKAWLTIQRGCDKFCTFCIVPFVRGRERSISLASIVEETAMLVDRGVKEVTLLGQTVNSYYDGKHDFADLLIAVGDVPGIERVRFTSPHPSDATEPMIRAMASHPKVSRHIHLPLQSGSNETLKRMRRTYTVEEFEEIVAALRDAMPDVGITTDVIVGFCGESEDEYRATYDAMERIRFDAAFMFKYSERDGTVAAKKFDDDIAEETKVRRLREIIDLQNRVSEEIYTGMVGKTARVLVDGES